MKRNTRIIFLSCGIIAALGSLAGCHKQCACIHNNGTTVYYSKSEVEESNGGNCSNMKYQSGTEYYSYCNWD